MSNETKQNVFNALMADMSHGSEQWRARYDAAFPDDLPVIPQAVGEYIKKANACGKLSIIDPLWHVGDTLSAMGESGLGDRARWVLHHSDDFARAWVLGVWRVEETGEIVKLEAEK
ncbi:hypothetical protein V6C66_12805 [Lacticaseibacillus paracasei]|uniref:hypothetical protein n=1 Tax=Lacticaseibacillus paracasei TaxID=1597 RepID=UPI002FD8C97D